MNISKMEQRTLHALAQGGEILVRREELAAPQAPGGGRPSALASGLAGRRPVGPLRLAGKPAAQDRLAEPVPGSEPALKRKPKITSVECYNRDGHRLVDCRLGTFQRLKRRGFIASSGGGPYRITRQGLAAVRAQADQR